MAAMQPAGSWDENTPSEWRWTFLDRNGRVGDPEDWPQVFERDQPRL